MTKHLFNAIKQLRQAQINSTSDADYQALDDAMATAIGLWERESGKDFEYSMLDSENAE